MVASAVFIAASLQSLLHWDEHAVTKPLRETLPLTRFLAQPYRLELVSSWTGICPAGAASQLRLVGPATTTPVSNLNTLAGAVTISTPAEALAYVRTRTDFRTFRFFSPCWMEVRSEVPIAEFGAWSEYAPSLKSYFHTDPGVEGIVDPPCLQQVGYTGRTATKDQAAPYFQVQRLIIETRTPTEEAVPLMVTERVATNGSYQVLATKPVTTHPDRIHWRITGLIPTWAIAVNRT